MATATHSLSSPSNSNSGRTPPNAENNNGDTFPVGLRVLVVDDDPICLLILDRMLRRCQYQVTTCGKATEALAMLRENKNNFDVILSDVYMPDMDGFKLLELVGLEMDLPVIMMSANGETSAVMKGIKHGACDYLLKPVRMEELRNIWQHVLRKKWRNSGQTASNDEDKNRQAPDENEYNSSANEDGTWKQSKKRKEVKEEEEDPDIDNDDPSTTKKPRVVWSVELHQQFVNAVNQLGIDKAVPKRILELMNVQGLTRENVASHLQKYRLYLKRISGVAHPQGGLNPSFSATGEANFGAVAGSGMAGLGELRSLGPTNNMSPQALVSTLQAGLLGRLGNNIGLANVDPSILLQIAALQSANNGGLTRSAQLPSYSQPPINSQGTFQAVPSDMNQLQVSQLGAYAGSIDKGPTGLSPLQQHQLVHQSNYTGLGQLNNNIQPVNTNSNALGQLPVVGNNISQVNTVSSPLAQLAAINNNIQQVTNSNSLGQLSVASGNIQQVNPSLGPISNVGNNHQQVNTNNNPLLLQALQQQQAAKSNLNMPLRGQHGISADAAAAWAPNISATCSGLAGQNSGPLRQMSMPTTVGASSVANVLGAAGRTTDTESQSLQLPAIGSTAVQNNISVSSPLGASGIDDLSAGRIKDISSSLPITNDALAHNFGSKFPLHSGLKQGQGHQSVQRNQSSWQGFGLGQEYGQISNGHMRSASFNQLPQLPNNGQGFNHYGVGQDHNHISSPNFSTGVTNNYRSLSDSSMKIKEEGHEWLPEPLTDDLLNIVFKQQQQEALGLTESQPGGADSYVMDNMYVK